MIKIRKAQYFQTDCVVFLRGPSILKSYLFPVTEKGYVYRLSMCACELHPITQVVADGFAPNFLRRLTSDHGESVIF